MIAVISAWIKEIISVVLFATFLDLLLPSSSMQKFIRVIVGLFIMLAILNPFIDVIQNRTTLSRVPVVSGNLDNSPAIVDMNNAMITKREQLSVELYKKELAKQIRALVIAVEGVADAKVSVDVDNNRSKQGAIKGIVVYIQPGINSPINSVEKVTIGRETPSTLDIEFLKPQIKQKIQNSVSELLQIPREKIEVKLLHRP